MFKKYQHVERFGNNEVDGIEIGITHVFPKIDGTNSSVWFENGEIQAGSRNRHLAEDEDNAGFYKWVKEFEPIIKYFEKHPEHRLYGEWLVPHSLKTYREEAWRNFYVFDVTIDVGENVEYLAYETYIELLEEFNIDYVPLLCNIKEGSYEMFLKQLEKNTYLIKDGEGTGEGIVIKNYDFYNKYHRQTWAKIVSTEFKEKNMKSFGSPFLSSSFIEEKIVDELLTETFIEKEYSKIAVDGWENKYIPKLLGVVWYEFIKDESWNIVKKYNNPKIDFKLLQRFVTSKTKKIKKDIF